jgi:hypothetical protein
MSFINFGKFAINKNIISSVVVSKRILYIKYPWKLTVHTSPILDNDYFRYYENKEDAEKYKEDLIKKIEN